MGCPCNDTKAKQYAYTNAEGVTKVYATEVEAIAAKIRNGNAGEVKPV